MCQSMLGHWNPEAHSCGLKNLSCRGPNYLGTCSKKPIGFRYLAQEKSDAPTSYKIASVLPCMWSGQVRGVVALHRVLFLYTRDTGVLGVCFLFLTMYVKTIKQCLATRVEGFMYVRWLRPKHAVQILITKRISFTLIVNITFINLLCH